jgi:hypothetical protein
MVGTGALAAFTVAVLETLVQPESLEMVTKKLPAFDAFN